MGRNTQTLLHRLCELFLFALVLKCYGKTSDNDLALVRYRGRVLKICSGKSVGGALTVISGNNLLTTEINAGLENPGSHMYIGDSRLRGRRHCGNGILQFLEFNKSKNSFNALAADDVPSIVKHSSFVVSVTDPRKSNILLKGTFQHDLNVTGQTGHAASTQVYAGSVNQLEQQYAPHHKMIQEFMQKYPAKKLRAAVLITRAEDGVSHSAVYILVQPFCRHLSAPYNRLRRCQVVNAFLATFTGDNESQGRQLLKAKHGPQVAYTAACVRYVWNPIKKTYMTMPC